MIILIKSSPYGRENVLGALFLALSSAEFEVRTRVVFVGMGKWNLLPNQNESDVLAVPSISDLILQLVGMVEFYFIPADETEVNEVIKTLDRKDSRVPGIKPLSYAQLIQLLTDDPKNVLIL